MNDQHKDVAMAILTGIGLSFAWIFTHLGLLSQFVSLISGICSAAYWIKKINKEE